MNLRLFLLTFLIESIILIGCFFLLGMLLFLYFGSGAGASSEKAIMTEKISFVILILSPLIYGIYKNVNSKDKIIGRSYLYASFTVTIISGIYFGKFIY
ncbi:MAG: hypothetical protein KGZ81_07735 [Flavobacteriales bacterium]|nr:hypothetical protein [Flavobacteriales bacterium]